MAPENIEEEEKTVFAPQDVTLIKSVCSATLHWSLGGGIPICSEMMPHKTDPNKFHKAASNGDRLCGKCAQRATKEFNLKDYQRFERGTSAIEYLKAVVV